MHLSHPKSIRIVASVVLTFLNLAIVTTTVRATVNQGSFPLVVVLAAISVLTLVSVWRHSVADTVATK